MIRRRWSFPLIATWVAAALAACATPAATSPAAPEERTLTVFAAASLTEAFREIGAAFEAANPGVSVVFNFANARALRTQIEEGAIADVFASANPDEIDALAAADELLGAAEPFARNELAIIVPPDNPAGLETPWDLARPGLKLVLAAEEVPVGKYARQMLEQMDGLYGAGYRDAVMANAVSNEDNVKQVVAKVQLGEADAGIVYASDAMAAPELVRIEIPADVNVIAVYPIAVLQSSLEPELGQAFTEYVLSDAGQAVLQAWGFRAP